MSWVLSMAVVDGLSAQQIAGRLEAELGEETTSDSPSGQEAGPGPGLPAVGVHGDGRAVILDDRDADAPVLEDARLLARLSHGTRVVLFELSERVNCGFFRVGCWVDGAMAWQIIHCRDEPDTEEYQILGIPRGSLPTRRRRIALSRPKRMPPGRRTSAIWGRPWWSCLSRSPASTTTEMVGGGTCGIEISSPSIEPQAELT